MYSGHANFAPPSNYKNRSVPIKVLASHRGKAQPSRFQSGAYSSEIDSTGRVLFTADARNDHQVTVADESSSTSIESDSNVLNVEKTQQAIKRMAVAG
jgi:hypothetical protein